MTESIVCKQISLKTTAEHLHGALNEKMAKGKDRHFTEEETSNKHSGRSLISQVILKSANLEKS